MILAANAALDLFEKHNVNPEDIDCDYCCNSYTRYVFPANCLSGSKKIGAINAWGFDLAAACSGFLFAFQTGCSID
ncbi:MAG: hypothetical protein MZV64_67605 [Ignavibacteriales bacterium]|nr:hypothetical protein [Ignavibacteriales bacterium]